MWSKNNSDSYELDFNELKNRLLSSKKDIEIPDLEGKLVSYKLNRYKCVINNDKIHTFHDKTSTIALTLNTEKEYIHAYIKKDAKSSYSIKKLDGKYNLVESKKSNNECLDCNKCEVK